MAEERNPVVEAVLTDGVLTHLVTESNDHGLVESELTLPPTGIGDRIYLKPEVGFAVLQNPLASAFIAWELYDADLYPSVGNSVSLDEDGQIVVVEGVYAFAWQLVIDALDEVVYGHTTYDKEDWGGTKDVGPSLVPATVNVVNDAVTSRCVAGIGFAVNVSANAASTIIGGYASVIRLS